MSLRRIGISAALVAAAGTALYVSQHGDQPEAPVTTYRSFPVQQTTTITEGAGSLTLRFSPPLRVVMAAKASTDKGYFSLQCMGRSSLVGVPGNGTWKTTTCRIIAVHYTDNSARTGLVILKPQR